MLFGAAGGGRRAGVLFAILVAAVCLLVAPVVASAETFEVNSTGDAADAVPGDEFCATAGGVCTFRAALKESSTLEGEDVIGFDEAVFDGSIGGTISLGSSLPAIEGIVSIEGECVLAADLVRPCVGVDGPNSSEPALIVKDTEAVRVVGLAITGAATGIEVTGTPRFKALSDWLGVKLDGSAGGNGTGMLLGPGSNNSQIGNEGETNVFANNTADGLAIHGVSGVRVLGGYFGVGPDGVTPAPNGGKGIEVASFAGSEAVGNTIGTQLSGEEAASPECDGGCNLISASGSSGIDLEGDGGEEAPAVATAIFSNYIGLDASGTGAIPNGSVGIRVGQAAGTFIGGPRATEANRLAGGAVAVSAGPGAANLVVRGNSVGVGADGRSLVAPGAGIVVNSEGLPGPSAEAVVAGNEIRMSGGVAIDQQGLGGWFVGNAISGADTGIRAAGEVEGHGSLIQGNAIEGSAINGILIESGRNEIVGNRVLGSGGAGIRIAGATLFPDFGVSRNVIGGDTGADENLIAGSGGAAIEIANPELATNEVARNRGFANGGLFIDLELVAALPSEKKGTNEGIEPPKFDFATQSEAAGWDALPEARIRVFRKASAASGEIESFLGEAIADEDGEWSVAYGAAIPAGTIVAATQTSPVGGTSELAVATTPVEPRAGSGPCASCAAAPSPTPQTKILTGHKGKKLVRGVAAFKFKANISGSSFQCRLDGGRFKKCHSPMVYASLKPGAHRFEVRAIGATGEVEPTPAKLKFTVLP